MDRADANGGSRATGSPVAFESGGERVVGRLFSAAFGRTPGPGIVILGPMTFQKEQAPTLYAQRLAQLGFTTLIFDPRYRGESGGEPRCLEDPLAKVADARAAADYLGQQPSVDPERLGLLGICMGASHALRAAADEPLIAAVATVTGHYRDRAGDVSWLGSEQAVAERHARGQRAREKYETTREADFVPAVDFDRTDVGMPGQLVWSWYQLWADRGLWENRYAVMSDEPLLDFESLSAAARLEKPYLMIHADLCALPDCARRHFAVVPTPDKKLIWEGETRHLQYYDDPVVIERAAINIADWFSRHLHGGYDTTAATANGQTRTSDMPLGVR
jgi:uncharacterized protein